MEGYTVNASKTGNNGMRAGLVEVLISGLLRVGVSVSLVTILIGLLLMFLHHPDYLRSSADLSRLINPGAAFPHSIREVMRGAYVLSGQAIVAVGLCMLIATPILRVAVSIVLFGIERDRAFVVITSTVLAVLLISFLLGTGA
jgi:uncharacterized membrane protein